MKMRDRRRLAFLSLRWAQHWRPCWVFGTGPQLLYFGTLSNPEVWGNPGWVRQMQRGDSRS